MLLSSGEIAINANTTTGAYCITIYISAQTRTGCHYWVAHTQIPRLQHWRTSRIWQIQALICMVASRAVAWIRWNPKLALCSFLPIRSTVLSPILLLLLTPKKSKKYRCVGCKLWFSLTRFLCCTKIRRRKFFRLPRYFIPSLPELCLNSLSRTHPALWYAGYGYLLYLNVPHYWRVVRFYTNLATSVNQTLICSSRIETFLSVP